MIQKAALIENKALRYIVDGDDYMLPSAHMILGKK